MTRLLVSVAVPTPLRQTFDYFVPISAAPPLAPGARVRIAFGRRKLVGIATSAPRPATGSDARDYKPIEDVLDDGPLLPPDLLALCHFAADYYQHPPGEVFATALPGLLRRGGPALMKRERQLRITARGREALVTMPTRATQLRRLLAALAASETVALRGAAVRRALREGWVEAVAVAPAAQAGTEQPPTPTSEQAQALRALEADPPGFAVTLLQGVTGSGKTEVYLQRIAELVRNGKQALVLAPEIGLTPQLVERFQRRLGSTVAAFHSGMSETERTQSWLRARSGEAGVVIGTRSAVFVPFARLGLVVVDEEHDTSYKQQDGLRYSARDLAIWRARHAGIPAILGSATPSLESLQHARSGRYRHLHLRKRSSDEAPPQIQLLDVRTRPLEGGLSPPLLEAVERHVGAGGQVLLFLNRRGYAPTLLCEACGWIAACKRCDARLSMHRYGARLVCHHCGAQSAAPKACPSCAATDLKPLGQGTERVEQTLRERFPQMRVERMDSDRLAKAGELQRLLADIGSGAVQVLVGTQLLAKGHDFTRLSLVGIVSADQALYGSDFRALERVGQIITQVAGRAGRSGGPAQVILQTREPSHPMLKLLLSKGYDGLCEALLQERQSLQMPPFAHLALLRAESVAPAAALEFLAAARKRIGAPSRMRVGEPVASPMERRAGRYRAQLLLQSATRPPLQKLLSECLPQIEQLPEARRVRWSVDVDPADLF